MATNVLGLFAPDPSRASLDALGVYLGAAAPSPIVAFVVGLVCAALSILLRFAGTPCAPCRLSGDPAGRMRLAKHRSRR